MDMSRITSTFIGEFIGYEWKFKQTCVIGYVKKELKISIFAIVNIVYFGKTYI